ncbi:MAG: hypothetical protein K2O73_05665 [Lachnospiraceae bacterium]|nr:hypothetical protein [Lachnospiraceae bacterium]
MDKQKRCLRLAFIICLMLLCLAGCSPGTQNGTSQKGHTGDGQEGVTQTEGEEQLPEQQLYLLSQMDTEQGLITLLNLDTGRYEQYAYTDGTFFLDKYGSNTSSSDFAPGMAVHATLRENSLMLEKLCASDTVWEYDDVRRFEVDEEDAIITLGDTKYSYDDMLMVFSGEEATDLGKLTEQDVLRVYGVDRKILSVLIVTGHGVIQLQNTADLEGGWLSLNHKSYYKITEDMEVEVPEGDYEVTVAGNGYGGSVDVAVTRDTVSTINVDEIKGEGPKYCTLTFAIGVEGAQLYIDGVAVDYSQPLQLKYGIHRLQVDAEGYETWSRRLFVNSEEAVLEVGLTSSGGVTSADGTESGANTNNGSSADNTNDSSGTGKVDEKYLEKLNDLVDAVIDTQRIKTSSGILNSVLNDLF